MSDGVLYFSNFTDQRLYSLKPGAAEPQALAAGDGMRYADGAIDRRGAWVGVRENHSIAGREAVNEIVRVDVARRSGARVRSRFLFFAAALA